MSKKPKSELKFFENYKHHLNFLTGEFHKKVTEYHKKSQDGEAGDFLQTELLKRLSFVDPLYDGYDYFDEVFGATAVPLIGAVGAFVYLGKSIWEAIQLLAMKVKLKQDDHKDHGELAGHNLFRAGLAISVAFGSLIKSIISLVTRPIATLVQGYKAQNCDRFAKNTTSDARETLTEVFL